MARAKDRWGWEEETDYYEKGREGGSESRKRRGRRRFSGSWRWREEERWRRRQEWEEMSRRRGNVPFRDRYHYGDYREGEEDDEKENVSDSMDTDSIEYKEFLRRLRQYSPMYGFQKKANGSNHTQTAYRLYVEKWSEIQSSTISEPLGYNDIPWPPLNNPLYIEHGDSQVQIKSKLKRALLIWHPDKFLTIVGDRLTEYDKKQIQLRATEIAHAILRWREKVVSL